MVLCMRVRETEGLPGLEETTHTHTQHTHLRGGSGRPSAFKLIQDWGTEGGRVGCRVGERAQAQLLNKMTREGGR